MKLEYLIDEKGNQKAVVIPISDWKKFFSDYINNEKKKTKVLSKKKIDTSSVFGLWKDDFEKNESSEDIQRRWRKEEWR